MARRAALIAGLIFGVAGTASAAQHPCAADAGKQAKQLLLFHTQNDDRAEVADAVKVLPALKNPANPAQRFDVLEVMGYVYKGQYRMRMIYAQTPGSCVLMGQEIMELASL